MDHPVSVSVAVCPHCPLCPPVRSVRSVRLSVASISSHWASHFTCSRCLCLVNRRWSGRQWVSAFLPPASCLLPPASCLLPPAIVSCSCFPIVWEARERCELQVAGWFWQIEMSPLPQACQFPCHSMPGGPHTAYAQRAFPQPPSVLSGPLSGWSSRSVWNSCWLRQFGHGHYLFSVYY